MDKIKSQCCKCSHSIEIHYALSQADGYDPKKSRVSDDTLADFFRSQLTGKDHLVAAAAAAAVLLLLLVSLGDVVPSPSSVLIGCIS